MAPQEVVEFLFEKEAIPGGNHCSMLAKVGIRHHQTDISEYLADKQGITMENVSDGLTLLRTTCPITTVEMITLLSSERGAKLESPGSTFLEIAIRQNQLDSVEFLTKSRGFEIANNLDICIVLQDVCASISFEIVEFLFENGAKIQNTSSGTALLKTAIRQNRVDIAKYLVNKENTTIKDIVGDNALLHDACSSTSLKMVKLLFGHGAKLDGGGAGLLETAIHIIIPTIEIQKTVMIFILKGSNDQFEIAVVYIQRTRVF